MYIVLFIACVLITCVLILSSSRSPKTLGLPGHVRPKTLLPEQAFDWSGLEHAEGGSIQAQVYMDVVEGWAKVQVELTWEPAGELGWVLMAGRGCELELMMPDQTKVIVGEVELLRGLRAPPLSSRQLFIEPDKRLLLSATINPKDLDTLLSRLVSWVHDQGLDDVRAPERGALWRWSRDVSTPLSFRLSLLGVLGGGGELLIDLHALEPLELAQVMDGLRAGRLRLGADAPPPEPSALKVLLALTREPVLDAPVAPLEVSVLTRSLHLLTKHRMIKLNEEGVSWADDSLPESSLWWLVDRLLAHGELTQVGEGALVLWWRLLEGKRLDGALIKVLTGELFTLPATRVSLALRWCVFGWGGHLSPLPLALKRQAMLVCLPHIEQGLLLECLRQEAQLWEDDALRQALNHYIFERDESAGWQDVLEASLATLGEVYARELLARAPRARMMHATKREVLLSRCQQIVARHDAGKLTMSDAQETAGALTSAPQRHDLTRLDDV